MANFVTLSYFLYFIPMLPLIGFLENAIITYELRYAVLALPARHNKVFAETNDYTTCNLNDKTCGINFTHTMKKKDIEMIKETEVTIKENITSPEILLDIDPITKLTLESSNANLSIFNIFSNNKINFVDTLMNQFLFLHS
jgi:hypothetical protein